MKRYKITNSFKVSNQKILAVKVDKNVQIFPGVYTIEKAGKNSQTVKIGNTQILARSKLQDQQAINVDESVNLDNLDDAYLVETISIKI